MESELQADLFEALEGIDPLELLINDPDLAAVAKDIEDAGSGLLLSDSFVKQMSSKQKTKKKYIKNEKKSYNCVVCRASAKGFHYYGAIVCSSCRAFFKRSVQDNAYKGFLCRQGDSACMIDSKSWSSCQLCRFNLCCKQGMKIPDSNKNIEILECDTPSQSEMSLVPVKPSQHVKQQRKELCDFLKDRMKDYLSNKLMDMLSPCSNVTMTEMISLEKVSHMQLNVENKILQTVLMGDLTFMHKLLEFIYLGKTNPIYMNKGLEDYIMLCGTEVYMNSAGEMGEIVDLKDRSRLARGNMPLVIEYLTANRIGTLFDPAPAEAGHYENLLESDPDKEVGRKMYEVHLEV